MADKQYFTTDLVIQAMRDSGYKNPAMALAELIDNSIQADAKDVRFATYSNLVGGKWSLSKVAVLDDGCGMDADCLENSLQFGNGTHLDDHSGIGKFGMGLPNSSISQCMRVDVYTWQSSDGDVLTTHLDIDEIRSKNLSQVPAARRVKMPEEFSGLIGARGNSGTLVVWSKLDRLLLRWKTDRGLWPNLELEIGRLYRKFIDSGEVSISHHPFVRRGDTGRFERKTPLFAKPNDPLYLMANTSCPVQDSGNTESGQPIDEPMFREFGIEQVPYKDPEGNVHVVTIRFALAKPQALDFGSAGAKPHGKHAEKNMGVSVVRARRELHLQKGWCLSSEARDRWWGAEVDFPPFFDELFGVTNNKQEARELNEMAGVDLDTFAQDHEYTNALHLLEQAASGDPLLWVKFKVAHLLKRNIKLMRDEIKAMRATTDSPTGRGGKGTAGVTAEKTGTEATRKRVEGGKAGTSDAQSKLPEDQRIQELKKYFVDSQGMDAEEAFQKATEIIQSKLRYIFQYGPIPSPDFFTPTIVGGIYQVKINTRHPVYTEYMQKIQDLSSESDPASIKEALHVSQEVFKLLLESWVRYEDETTDPDTKDQLAEHRVMWGLMAQDFIKLLKN